MIELFKTSVTLDSVWRQLGRGCDVTSKYALYWKKERQIPGCAIIVGVGLKDHGFDSLMVLMLSTINVVNGQMSECQVLFSNFDSSHDIFGMGGKW